MLECQIIKPPHPYSSCLFYIHKGGDSYQFARYVLVFECYPKLPRPVFHTDSFNSVGSSLATRVTNVCVSMDQQTDDSWIIRQSPGC